ncbi:MAG TPA: type II toxin-antitoxin system RelE/ParE family toxin [Burkholderiales bacterium]|nr:type II toxin-antitoxin system RelE/ParE family toxin [Burkholderiales bacterium]
MAEISWTAEAERWLNDIYEYIAADNPDAAVRTVQSIYDRAQDLRQFPQLGTRYAASPRHVRVLLYEHYRIAYLIKDDGNIDTVGVFHGALDIARYHSNQGHA